MKLLFITTGGTIGSTVQSDSIAPNNNQIYKMMEQYEEQSKEKHNYTVIAPFLRLSENCTGKTLSVLMQTVIEYKDKDYDGIIITYGTDTLQYAAAAVAYAVGSGTVPICFVSSNYPLEDERANGMQNLAGAIAFMRRKEVGVWVVYQNKGENIKVHCATRLLAHPIYSDRIDSILDAYRGTFDAQLNFYDHKKFKAKEAQMKPLCNVNLDSSCKVIYQIVPCPGYAYPKVNELKDKGVKFVLHGTYHSGTIRTDHEEVEQFFRELKEQGIKVFLTGVLPGISYESTNAFKNYSIQPTSVIAPIALYIKLWMMETLNMEIEQNIEKILAHDILESDEIE